MDPFEYNTTCNELTCKEYGRNIQKMIGALHEIEDRNIRTEAAKAAIKVMSHVNPENKDNEKLDTLARNNESEAYWRKLWDHLFIIAGKELDVDAPFEKPEMEKIEKAKVTYTYSKGKMANRSYGRHIEDMIKAIAELPEEERDMAAPFVANHFKKIYLTHNKKSVEDSTIIEQVKELSGGKITLPEDLTFESTKQILKTGAPASTTTFTDNYRKKAPASARKRRAKKHK